MGWVGTETRDSLVTLQLVITVANMTEGVSRVNSLEPWAPAQGKGKRDRAVQLGLDASLLNC